MSKLFRLLTIVAVLGLLATMPAQIPTASAASPTPEWEVVDANGTRAGFLLDRNLLIRKVSSYWVAIPFTPREGFETSGDPHALLYTTEDCTGTAYWDADQEPQNGTALAGTLHYGSGAILTLNIVRSTTPGTTECNVFEAQNYPVRVAATYDLSSFNFTPPFRVVRQ